jgi:hypothetical protein
LDLAGLGGTVHELFARFPASVVAAERGVQAIELAKQHGSSRTRS